MFAGSDEGAESAAVMFSLLGACQVVGIDPDRYLRGTLDVPTTDRLREPWSAITSAAQARRTIDAP